MQCVCIVVFSVFSARLLNPANTSNTAAWSVALSFNYNAVPPPLASDLDMNGSTVR